MVKGAAGELAPTILDLRRKGYSYREIAQTLGVSTKLVYNVLHSTPDTENTGNTGATMPPTTPCTTDRVETHPGQPDTGDTPQTAGGATQTLKVEARETVETPWKYLETLGKHPGSTQKQRETPWKHLETLRLTLAAAGNIKETLGNSWKHLETLPGALGEAPRIPPQLWAATRGAHPSLWAREKGACCGGSGWSTWSGRWPTCAASWTGSPRRCRGRRRRSPASRQSFTNYKPNSNPRKPYPQPHPVGEKPRGAGRGGDSGSRATQTRLPCRIKYESRRYVCGEEVHERCRINLHPTVGAGSRIGTHSVHQPQPQPHRRHPG